MSGMLPMAGATATVSMAHRPTLTRVGTAVWEKTGAALISPFPLARLERGRGRPMVTRLPYVREQARAVLEPFRQFILIGTTEPFAYFAMAGDAAVLLPDGAVQCALTGPDSDIIALLE